MGIFLTKKKYVKKKSWKKFYKKGSLRKAKIDSTWKEMFDQLSGDTRFAKIEETLKSLIPSQGDKIYPKPCYVFEAFRMTGLDDLKVVIVGQDPYFNHEFVKNKPVPQAMGLSFSVPDGIRIPSSLDNIYKNMIRNGHMRWYPRSGNLTFWAHQGCLMLNTALTVLDGQKNCHSAMWAWFTNMVLKYISDHADYVVFVFWGAPALSKSVFVDLDKHDCIVSSHPSGLSADKPLKQYPPFNEFDHFGKINELLKAKGREQIIWQV